jgi:hypothetical protein
MTWDGYNSDQELCAYSGRFGYMERVDLSFKHLEAAVVANEAFGGYYRGVISVQNKKIHTDR